MVISAVIQKISKFFEGCEEYPAQGAVNLLSGLSKFAEGEYFGMVLLRKADSENVKVDITIVENAQNVKETFVETRMSKYLNADHSVIELRVIDQKEWKKRLGNCVDVVILLGREKEIALVSEDFAREHTGDNREELQKGIFLMMREFWGNILEETLRKSLEVQRSKN